MSGTTVSNGGLSTTIKMSEYYLISAIVTNVAGYVAFPFSSSGDTYSLSIKNASLSAYGNANVTVDVFLIKK